MGSEVMCMWESVEIYTRWFGVVDLRRLVSYLAGWTLSSCKHGTFHRARRDHGLRIISCLELI